MLCLSCQRYKSKAIHNTIVIMLLYAMAVFIMSKIQIESNSQLLNLSPSLTISCVYHVKDTNRKQFTTCSLWTLPGLLLCLSCQRYKSKAIHNEMENIRHLIMAVFIMSKIQIESNSQQEVLIMGFRNAVFIMSKIQIESNSQHLSSSGLSERSCVYHVKDTNRKQFTTLNNLLSSVVLLCLSCQRYKSKAIHNRPATIKSAARAVFNIYSHRAHLLGVHDFRSASFQTCPTETVVQAGIQIETDEGGS